MATVSALLDPGCIDPGSSVLVAGPVMTGKRTLHLRLLAKAGSDPAPTVLVTTRKSADAAVSSFRDVVGPIDDDDLAVVDTTGTEAFRSRQRVGANRRYVSSPGDLTGIGIGITEFMRRFYHRGTPGQVGLHSLSTMLMYTEFRRLFQFLHVVVGRIESSDFCGVFVIDDSALDDREWQILLQLFDSVVETRDAGSRQLRVRGDHAGELGPTSWTEF